MNTISDHPTQTDRQPARNIEIVKLAPEQWQRYRAIRLDALRTEPQAFGSTFAEMEQKPPAFWQGRLADAELGETSWLLFAQEGEQLIGLIGAFYEAAQSSARIISVYVTQARRGQGVGRMLMEAILSELARKDGIHRMTLGVNREQAPAVKLYRQFGFEVVEEIEELQGDGKLHPGYEMAKQMAPRIAGSG